MTEEQFLIIAKTIKTFYPDKNIIQTNEEATLWYEMLKDIEYDAASAAVKRWVSLNKWCPTIADIRELSTVVKGNTVNEWEEEWDKVIDAVHRYGYTRPEEALNSLPDMTRNIVKRLGYKTICMSENISIERANFRDVYNREADKQREQNILSKDLKSEILSISQSAVKAIEG